MGHSLALCSVVTSLLVFAVVAPGIARSELSEASVSFVGTVTNVASYWDPARETVMTLTTFRTDIAALPEVRVRTMGGVLGDLSVYAFGQPTFSLGEQGRLVGVWDGDVVYAPLWRSSWSPLSTNKGYQSFGADAFPREATGNDPTATPTKTGGEGYEDSGRKWLGFSVGFKINPAGPSDVTQSQFISAVQASFQAWTNDPGSPWTFTYDGTTSASPSNHVDWTSTVGWVITTDSSFLARTACRGSPIIVECDIEFNDYDRVFDWTTTGTPGRYDVQNTGTHEAGHWLALNHVDTPEDTEQTMYFTVQTVEETKRRTLDWGDIAGLRIIYNTGGDTPTNSWYVQGSDVTLYQLNGDLQPDALHAWINNPLGANDLHWCFSDGVTSANDAGCTHGVQQFNLNLGHESQGLGIDTSLIDSDTTRDVVVAWVDNPSGENIIKYVVGWDLRVDSSGASPSGGWSGVVNVPGWVGSETQGLGLAILNIGGTSSRDMVLYWVDRDPAVSHYFKIGWDLTTGGTTSSWTDARLLFQGGGSPSNYGIGGAGISFADIDRNGVLDAVVVSSWPGQFRIAWDISSSGWFAGVSRAFRLLIACLDGCGVDIMFLDSPIADIMTQSAVEEDFSARIAYSWV